MTRSRAASISKIAAVFTLFMFVIVFTFPSLVFSQSGLREAGNRWPADRRLAIDQIKHDPFDGLLKKYVDSDGMVDYRRWHANVQDRKVLTQYISDLSRADHSLPAGRNAKLAYWINAYNAVTLQGILAVYPTTSIRKHTAKLGYNIWDDLKLITGDQSISLNDIEHKVLRKMNEPRIHFAIVCASVGCPRLLNEAYKPDKLENQLVLNSTDFFSRDRNLQFVRSTNQLKLSSIMKWFGSDFGSDTNRQISAVLRYFPEPVRQAVKERGISRVDFLDYDWNLNSQ